MEMALPEPVTFTLTVIRHSKFEEGLGTFVTLIWMVLFALCSDKVVLSWIGVCNAVSFPQFVSILSP